MGRAETEGTDSTGRQSQRRAIQRSSPQKPGFCLEQEQEKEKMAHRRKTLKEMQDLGSRSL